MPNVLLCYKFVMEPGEEKHHPRTDEYLAWVHSSGFMHSDRHSDSEQIHFQGRKAIERDKLWGAAWEAG